MKNGVSTVTLDELIAAALTGQPYNQLRLGTQARLYSRRLSKAYGKEFPEDLHDEVFGQALSNCSKPGRLPLPTVAAKLSSGVRCSRRSARSAQAIPRPAVAPARCPRRSASWSPQRTSAASPRSR